MLQDRPEGAPPTVGPPLTFTLRRTHFTRSIRTVTGPGLSKMETSPVT